MIRDCSDCYWCGGCDDLEYGERCPHYTPYRGEAYDMLIDEYIERGRAEYREAWADYIRDNE